MLVQYSTIACKTAPDMVQAVIAEASVLSLSVAVCIVDLSGNVFEGGSLWQRLTLSWTAYLLPILNCER
jgi:hypothetical protein